MKMTRKEKLQFLVNGTQLTFTAYDVRDDSEFISFVDKFGEHISYRKNLLISRRWVQ